METSGSPQPVRLLQIGDAVQLHKPPEKRSKNTREETWDGPYEVKEKGEQSTDHLIQRLCSRNVPTLQHIDTLKKKHEEVVLDALLPEEKVAPATDTSELHEVEAILGERGRSRASNHYLVEYKEYSEVWRQPAKNLNECSRVLKAWEFLPATQQKAKTAAALIANPDEVNLVMDLRLQEPAAARQLIKDVCTKLGISRKRLRAVVGSPCFKTFTQLDSVNEEEGRNFRSPVEPYPTAH